MLWGTLASTPTSGHADVTLYDGMTLNLPVVGDGAGLTPGQKVLLLQQDRRLVIVNSTGEGTVTPLANSVSMWTRLVVTLISPTAEGFPYPTVEESNHGFLPSQFIADLNWRDKPRTGPVPYWLKTSWEWGQLGYGSDPDDPGRTYWQRVTAVYQPQGWWPHITEPDPPTEEIFGAYAPYIASQAYVQMGSWGFGYPAETIATDANGQNADKTLPHATTGYAYPTSQLLWPHPDSKGLIVVVNKTAGVPTFADGSNFVLAHTTATDALGGCADIYTHRVTAPGGFATRRSISAPSGGTTPPVRYFMLTWSLT